MSKRKAPDQSSGSSSSSSSSSSFSSSSSGAPAAVVDVDTSPGINEKRAKFVDEMHAHLVCSITHELMIDPVIAEDGNSYERNAIEQWIRSNGTSPLIPDKRLDISRLVANRMAQSATTALVESGGCEAELANSWKEAKKAADLVLAEKHFAEGRMLEAAKLGLPKAQGVMASRYYNGTVFFAKDPAQCFYWAKKAAEGRDSLGQSFLAQAYYAGSGTTKDYAAALKWYELVVSSPSNSAYGVSCNNIGTIYGQGGFGVPLDHVKAASWFLKGGEAGISISQYQIAVSYKDGRGVTKDLAAARNWFQKSAAQDYPQALFELGKIEMQGTGGVQNLRAGLDHLLKASELGFEGAKDTIKRITEATA